MIILKMLHACELPDSSPRKQYQMEVVPEGAGIEFNRDDKGYPRIRVVYPSGLSRYYEPHGNTYVLDSGVIISVFKGRP